MAFPSDPDDGDIYTNTETMSLNVNNDKVKYTRTKTVV